MKEHSIAFANVYLTRRCNLKCGYCNVIGSTPVYPPISHYHENEKDLEWWVAFFQEWYKVYPETFFSIMGGEPLLLDWLPELVNELNKIGTLYTIISNCIDRRAIDKLLSNTNFIRGFTASCDVTDGELDGPRKAKSTIGYQTLLWLKTEFGHKIDCCAEVTTNAYNIDKLPTLLDRLDDHEVFSSVSVIDPKLSDWYDFSNIEYDPEVFVQKTPEVRKIFDYAQTKLFIHMPKLLDYMYDDLPYAIQDISDLLSYVSIDSDGAVRYSLRIRGKTVPRCITIKDLLNMKTNTDIASIVFSGFLEDQRELDKGINWSGIYMAKAIRMGDHDLQDKAHNLLTTDLSGGKINGG